MKEISESLNLMRLVLNGAISIYEAEGLEIAAILHQQGNKELLRALDAVAAALYFSKEEPRPYLSGSLEMAP